MKNISRRVFIKGMAVAAAATAASTVLAGCNFVPGTEEPEVVPTPANSFTYTNGDKSLVVTSTKCEITNIGASAAKTDNIYVTVNVNNNLAKTNFGSTLPTANKDSVDYAVVINGKFFDKDGIKIVDRAPVADRGIVNLMGKDIETVSKVDAKDYYLAYTGVADKWTKLELTFTVYTKVKSLDESSYAYNKVNEYTFTYNN